MRGRDTSGRSSDATAADGYVRISAYLPDAARLYFTLHCAGAGGCHRVRPLSIGAAFKLVGSDPRRSTMDLARRLVCSRCGGRHVLVDVRSDPRPPELFDRAGPLPETRADLSEPDAAQGDGGPG